MKSIDTLDLNGTYSYADYLLSPGSTRKEMDDKYDVYEESGVKEYWLVEPNDEVVFVYVLHDGKYIGLKPFTGGQALTSITLPEYTLELNQLFDKK